MKAERLQYLIGIFCFLVLTPARHLSASDTVSPSGASRPGQDSDGDTLLDEEELSLGTPINQAQPLPPRFAVIDLLKVSPSLDASEFQASDVNESGEVVLVSSSQLLRWSSGNVQVLNQGAHKPTDANFGFPAGANHVFITNSGTVAQTAYPTFYVDGDQSGATWQVPLGKPAIWLRGSNNPTYLPEPPYDQVGWFNYLGGCAVAATTTSGGQDIIYGLWPARCFDAYGRWRGRQKMFQWLPPGNGAILPNQTGTGQYMIRITDVNAKGAYAGLDADEHYVIDGNTAPLYPIALNDANEAVGWSNSGFGAPTYWDGTSHPLSFRNNGYANDLTNADLNNRRLLVGGCDLGGLVATQDAQTGRFFPYDLNQWLRLRQFAPSTTPTIYECTRVTDAGIIIARGSGPGGPGSRPFLLLPVEIAGDNDDDGDIDQADRQARDKHPIVLQRKLNKTNTARALIVRKIALSGVPVKLVKTGDEKIIVKSKQTGAVLMSENQSESSDIGPFVSQADYEITVEGVDNGKGTLALKIGDSGTPADPMPIRVLNADVIFRNGSQKLSELIGANVTHGGLDSGDGNVHDIGGAGPETLTLAQFYARAINSTKRRVTFKQTNYMAGRVWEKHFDNLLNGKYDNPSGAKPWNIFTTSDNYTTSNCLEWLHKQWRHAVIEVHSELQDSQQKNVFETAYYSGANVKELVPADLLKTIPGSGTTVIAYLNTLIAGANLLGKGDVDPNVFHNEWEGFNVLIDPIGPVIQGQIRTITPNSYFGSGYFEEVSY